MLPPTKCGNVTYKSENASDFSKNLHSQSQQMFQSCTNWTQWFPVFSTDPPVLTSASPHCCWPWIAAIRPGFDNLTTWGDFYEASQRFRLLKDFISSGGCLNMKELQKWPVRKPMGFRAPNSETQRNQDLGLITCEKSCQSISPCLTSNQTKKENIHLFTSVQAGQICSK